MFNIINRFKIMQGNQRVVALRQQSNLEGAIEAAHQVNALALEVYGTNHPKYALSINNLAGILFQLGGYKEAQPLFNQSIEILQRANKAKGRIYSASLNNLGETERLLGNFDKAIEAHEKALAARKNHGPAAEYGQSLHNLALAFKGSGQLDKAKVIFQIALQTRGQTLGKNHPDYVRTLNTLDELNEMIQTGGAE